VKDEIQNLGKVRTNYCIACKESADRLATLQARGDRLAEIVEMFVKATISLGTPSEITEALTEWRKGC
jgi:hypothetical protein